ncbi:hypothetical protein GTU99_29680 [Streptomyces sp. PRKS01-65]|nr:hypothetical protein [Streptomyces harenosi]NEY36279.1 hypothetical protein [Streptomyces harenosi]
MPVRPAHLPGRRARHGTVAAVGAALLLSACAAAPDGGGVTARPGAPVKSTTAAGRATLPGSAAEPQHARPALPGVGPATLADIPGTARQVLLVTGDGRDQPTSTVRLYQRTAAGGWKAVTAPWPAHNALKGWTHDHHLGDLRSPIGVFALTDAGGLLPDPGTRLPYDRSDAFTLSGTGFEGEPLEGSFDYVVAINYNREPGTSPLDWTRPQGAEKGGGIWVHVDHDGPTQACVSIAEEHIKTLLRTLDPALNPVIVMGDAATLAR